MSRLQSGQSAVNCGEKKRRKANHVIATSLSYAHHSSSSPAERPESEARNWRLLNSSEWIKFNGSRSEFSAPSYRSSTSTSDFVWSTRLPSSWIACYSHPRILNGEFFTFVSKFAPFMLRVLNYGNASHRQHENRQTLCFIYFFANWIFPLEAHDETSLGILRVKPEVFHFRFSSSFYLHYPTEVPFSAIDSREKMLNARDSGLAVEEEEKRRLAQPKSNIYRWQSQSWPAIASPTLKGFDWVRNKKASRKWNGKKANGKLPRKFLINSIFPTSAQLNLLKLFYFAFCRRFRFFSIFLKSLDLELAQTE